MNVSLVMFKVDGTRRDFPVEKDRIVIGRTSSCDLRIPLSSVSRQHCEVRVEGDQARLRDLGSSNGTYHNSVRIQEVTLKPGDEIAIGPVIFLVTIDGQPENLQPVRSGGAAPTPVTREEVPEPAARAPASEDGDEAIELPEIEEEGEEVEPLEVMEDQESIEPASPAKPAPVTDAAPPPVPPSAPAKPKKIEKTDEDEDLVLPAAFDEETHSPTVDLDDPIAALQAMADRESEDSGEIPLLEEDEDKS